MPVSDGMCQHVSRTERDAPAIRIAETIIEGDTALVRYFDKNGEEAYYWLRREAGGWRISISESTAESARRERAAKQNQERPSR